LAADDQVFVVDNVRSGYGEIEVLKGVSVSVRRGDILSIIGANGAGKSTLLRTLFGTVKVSSGDVYFEGRRVTNLPPLEILKLGVAYVPQGRTNFPAMTIQENLEMGAFIRRRDRPAILKDIDQLTQRFPVLERRQEKAGNLSGGQQQILEMAMALILHPKVVLIDEPTLGLSPIMMTSVFTTIQEINAAGTTIIMVEQNAKRSLEISHHAIVLDLGRKRFEGTGAEILANPEVRLHYLGL
jgi:branched-chain amino acid transport system ATP-binding protein